MTAAVMTHRHDLHMTGPLTASMLFHIALLVLAIMGLPYFKRDLPDLMTPVPVELVKVDELRQMEKKSSSAPLQRQAPPQEKPAEKVPPRPQAPQVTAKTPPKPMAVQKPDPDTATMPRDKKEEEAEVKPAKKTQPPKPNKKRPTPAQTAEQQDEAFQSVLRNLMPAEQTPAADTNAESTEKTPSPLANFAQQMTMSEQDALQRQLSECWNLMAGARYAEDLVVDIKLFMNPDRTVRDAQVLDQIRYFGDGYFRAAADSALRAVRNPHCNPLELPPNKYEQWKVITVTFDPRLML